MLAQYAKPGSDLYYAVRRLYDVERTAYIAVCAFCQTLNSIAEAYREPNIAEQKLLWWRAEVERFFADESHHPILKALQSVQSRLSKEAMLALVEANIFSLKTHIFDRRSELLQHYQHLGGIRFSLLNSILVYQVKKLSEMECHTLGVIDETARHLIMFRKLLGRQHLYFSLEDFQLEHIDPAPILRLQNLETLKPLFKKHYQFAKERFMQLDLKGRHPVRLETLLKLKQVAAIDRAACEFFKHHVELSPIRKLCIATFL